MVDQIKIWRKAEIIDWECKNLPSEISHNNLIFRCDWYPDGNVKSYNATDELGLRHSINRKDEYVISNSLHKAFNKLNGNYGNHNDFDFTNVVFTLSYLSKRYNMPLKSTYIRKIEIGVNIIVKKPPLEYIDKLQSIQFTKNSLLMTSNMSPNHYGRYIKLSDYRIKFYDKTKQTYITTRKKLGDEIIRYELVLERSQFIKKYLSNLEDLICYNKYGKLADLLQKTFFELKFSSNYHLDTLNTKEIELYFAGSSIEYWKTIKGFNKSTSSTKRQMYKSIIRKLESGNRIRDSLLIEVRQKIRTKIYEMAQGILTCNITEKET